MEINGENCKAIPGFSRYVISENGRIYRILALNKNEKKVQKDSPENLFIRESQVQFYKKKSRGRWSQVGLVNNAGKFTTAAVEKLLCNTFDLWPDSKNKFSISFKDGNHKNISISNVETSPQKPNNSKLTIDQVKDIQKLISKKVSLRKIADTYGVSDMQICRIKSGENWRKGGRITPVPQPPFKVEDSKLRRFLGTFEYSEIDKTIRRPFTIKRSDNPTDNKIIGVVNGFRLTKSHKNISRARILVFKLNTHFFNEEIALKTDTKIHVKDTKSPSVI